MPAAGVESIKQILSTPEKFSDETVYVLRRLFDVENDDQSKATKGSASTQRTKTGSTQNRNGTRRVIKTSGKHSQAEVYEHEVGSLAVQEQRTLATQVVNAVLKALAGKVKESVSINTPKRGLHERSPNKQSMHSDEERQSCKVDNVLHDDLAPVQVGLLAFAVLHNLSAIGDLEIQSPSLRLEKGMLSFVTKLLSMRRTLEAVGLLRILRQRLLSYLGAVSPQTKNARSPKVEIDNLHTQDLSRPISELLYYPRFQLRHVEVADVLSSYQLAVLRVAALQPPMKVVDSLFAAADPFSTSSPVSICSKRLNMSCASPEKMLKDTDMSIHLFQAAALKLAASKDSCSVRQKGLKLLTFALQSQLHISRKTRPTQNQSSVWSAFADCLSLLTRYSDSQASATLSAAKAAFDDLQGCFAKLEYIEPASGRVYMLLGQLALDAGNIEQAHLWTSDWVDETKNDETRPIIHCAAAVRLAGICLIQSHPNAADIFRKTRTLITKQLSGTANDFTLAIREAVAFCHSVINYMRSAKDAVERDDRSDRSSIEVACLDFLCTFTKFYKKFLGCGPDREEDRLSCSAYQSRRSLVLEALLPMIDAILSMIRQLISSCQIAWVTLSQSVNDCLSLVEHALADGLKRSSSTQQEASLNDTIRLRISETCWLYYDSSKEDLSDQCRILSLHKACSVLKSLSANSKARGSLPLKLHRLGRFYRKMGNRSEALSALNECLQESQELGCLSEAHKITSTTTVNALGRAETSKIFFSALKTWIDIRLENAEEGKTGEVFFDDTLLETTGRGLLLEWQLQHFSSTAFSSPCVDAARTKITMTCLELYPEQKHPLKRRRLLNNYLQHGSFQPGEEHKELLNTVEDIVDTRSEDDFAEDSDLAIFAEHLCASLQFCLGLQAPLETSKRFASASHVWQNVISKASHEKWVEDHVEDLDVWLKDLQMMVDFYNVTCSNEELALVYAVQYGATKSATDMKYVQYHVQAQIRIGALLLDLGYQKTAKLLLDTKLELHPPFANEFHLAQSYYWLMNRDLERCASHLRASRSSNAAEPHVSLPRLNKIEKIVSTTPQEVDYLLAEAALALENKGVMDALFLAKKSFAAIQRSWKLLEQHLKRKLGQGQLPAPKSEILAQRLAELELDDHTDAERQTTDCVYGPPFWPLIPRMLRTQFILAQITKRAGAAQEALNGLLQVAQLAEKVGNEYWLASTHIELADTACRSRQEQLGRENFEIAFSLLEKVWGFKNSIRYYYSLGYHHRVQTQWTEEMKAYENATNVLKHSTAPSSVQHLLRTTSGTLEAVMPNGSLEKEKKAVPKRMQAARKTANRNMSAISSKKGKPIREVELEVEFSSFRKRINQKTAECLLAQNNVTSAGDWLLRIEIESVDVELRIQVKTAWAMLLVHQATTALSKDAVLSMMPESTIAFPSVISNENGLISENELNITSMVELKSIDDMSTPTLKPLISMTCSSFAEAVQKDPSETMLDAFRSAFELVRNHVDNISVQDSTRIWSLLAETSMALSLPRFTNAQAPLTPTMAAYLMDLSKNLAAARERDLVEIYHAVNILSEPPSPHEWRDTKNSRSLNLNMADFTREFIQSIPASWTVLSVSTSEDKNYLHFSRYRQRQEPLTLRLPLCREREVDPAASDTSESFTISNALSTLRDIIAASDDTVNEARTSIRDLEKKGAKTKWWARREQLDRDLCDLLLNMQNMWLGGFRGIFSQELVDMSFLSRFRKSMEHILEKHLPSRQKRNRTNEHVQLSTQIYELFVNLGDPCLEEDAFEESLTDLLYFVVDILQYYNEPNAYDEIDFDAIVVETMDALRSYYETARAQSEIINDTHLILVLDKQLHRFPWESMPCLHGLSVSRVSSLIDLQDRIRIIREQQARSSSQSASTGVHTTPQNGTCILNPGGDLKKTEKRLKTPLEKLSSWTHIVGQEPTQSQFESALTPERSKRVCNGPQPPPILLYFGHNSGLQYIRPKRIKSLNLRNRTGFQSSEMTLPQSTPSPELLSNTTSSYTSTPKLSKKSRRCSEATCATTLLFGCSSANLKEQGEYEPYGCPKTYLLGGAPAVLGALWDVTDGDIDRFAQGVLTRWGLMDKNFFEDDSERGKLLKRKNRAKSKTKMSKDNKKDSEDLRTGEMALSEAAAKSRDDCYLKYLNAAAMVVYGVPVYLEPQKNETLSANTR